MAYNGAMGKRFCLLWVLGLTVGCAREDAARIAALEARIAALEAKLPAQVEPASRLIGLLLKREVRAHDFVPSHPELRAVEREIAALESRVDQETLVAVARQQLDELSSQYREGQRRYTDDHESLVIQRKQIAMLEALVAAGPE